jgi:hypothetical protein
MSNLKQALERELSFFVDAHRTVFSHAKNKATLIEQVAFIISENSEIRRNFNERIDILLLKHDIINYDVKFDLYSDKITVIKDGSICFGEITITKALDVVVQNNINGKNQTFTFKPK